MDNYIWIINMDYIWLYMVILTYPYTMIIYIYIYMDYIYGIVHMTITISILPYQELFHQVIPMNLRIYP